MDKLVTIKIPFYDQPENIYAQTWKTKERRIQNFVNIWDGA